MKKQNVVAIFERFQNQNPSPQTELEYTNDYTLLVAVVLSAQATDKGVNKATKGLFAAADCPQKMLNLGLDGVIGHVKTIGLYNSKAKNVMALSKILVEKYNGQVPNTLEDLESLPGVGRKTANVVLNTAFGHNTIAVDTHVFRVATRIGLVGKKLSSKFNGSGAAIRQPNLKNSDLKTNSNLLEVEKALLKTIPSPFLKDAHHWLILHGRYVCLAKSPKCKICPIVDLCEYKEKVMA